MQLVIEIPDQFSFMGEPQDVANQLKLNTALMLFKEDQISIGLAKDLAGIALWDFMQECGKRQIPVINYDPEDFEAELKSINQEFGR